MFAVGARRIDSLDVTESPFEKTMLKFERKNISNRTIYRWSTNCFNQQSNYFQPSQFKRPMEKKEVRGLVNSITMNGKYFAEKKTINYFRHIFTRNTDILVDEL